MKVKNTVSGGRPREAAYGGSYVAYEGRCSMPGLNSSNLERGWKITELSSTIVFDIAWIPTADESNFESIVMSVSLGCRLYQRWLKIGSLYWLAPAAEWHSQPVLCSYSHGRMVAIHLPKHYLCNIGSYHWSTTFWMKPQLTHKIRKLTTPA